MSSWDYRLVRQKIGDNGDVMVALHEVYYDDHDRVVAWTQEPTTIRGDTYWEAAEAVTLAGNAISRALLDVTTDDWVWRKPGTKATVLGPAR